MSVKPVALAKGLATFVPGMLRFACGRSSGTDSPRYCYSVWLRHLSMIAQCGLDIRFNTVAELGPGDSLGIGIAAMLTGADRYRALDAVVHARMESNLESFHQLTALFAKREAIPATSEFPEISPAVASLEFPDGLLDETRMAAALAPERVDAVRRALSGRSDGTVDIQYVAPWSDAANVESDSVDLAYSQAVLEHVDDIDGTYAALYRWLRSGAIMSHAIDFKCHGQTKAWFGHWTIPAWQWRLVRGRRPYFINRRSASEHLESIRKAGFEVIKVVPRTAEPAPRRALAADFRHFTDDDLSTSGMFVIARKP